MSKWRHSLSAQLFSGVLISLMLAAVFLIPCFVVGNKVLDKTVYGSLAVSRMADKQFAKLQDFVDQEQITTKNLHQLNAWLSRRSRVYLTIYVGDRILYESPMGVSSEPTEFDPTQYSPELENPDREYTLVFSDGVTSRVFLYYYAGGAYYYWVVVVSALLSFVVFSLCFITFVHRKLRYVKQLKAELDILAGGDLNHKVTLKGDDELFELAFGIDQMRRSIVAHQAVEEQMRSANSQLVTAMSHDLRTPLTSLLAYLELLDREKYENQEQMRHFIRRSLEKTLRIKSMADKLFEYFLVYSSEWEQPDMELTDADSLYQQFWGEYAFSLENEGFTVLRNFGILRGQLRVNIDLLRRAFDNLYSNLLKYADAGEPVELAYHQEKTVIHLSLNNRICALRDERQSTNIGLSTCERIIQYHGGDFRAEEVGRAFLVRITLPLAEGENDQEAPLLPPSGDEAP